MPDNDKFSLIDKNQINSMLGNCIALDYKDLNQSEFQSHNANLQLEIENLFSLQSGDLQHLITHIGWKAFGQVASLEGFVSKYKMPTKTMSNLPEAKYSDKYETIPDLNDPKIEKFSGYDQEAFLLYNFYFYLEIYLMVRDTKGKILRVLPAEKGTVLKIILNEMVITANAYLILKKYKTILKETIGDEASRDERLNQLMTNYVQAIKDCEKNGPDKTIEFCFPCATNNHAMYLTLILFFKDNGEKDYLVLRLDNSTKEKPDLISNINFDNQEHIQGLIKYLSKVSTISVVVPIISNSDEVPGTVKSILSDKNKSKLLPVLAITNDYQAIPPQAVRNCVVEGYRVGLWYRLQKRRETRGDIFFNWVMRSSLAFYSTPKGLDNGIQDLTNEDQEEQFDSALTPEKLDVATILRLNKTADGIMNQLAKSGVTWKLLLSKCIDSQKFSDYLDVFYTARFNSESSIFEEIIECIFPDMFFDTKDRKRETIPVKIDDYMELEIYQYTFNIKYYRNQLKNHNQIGIKVVFSIYDLQNHFIQYNFSVVHVEGIESLSERNRERLEGEISEELRNIFNIDWVYEEESDDSSLDHLIICNSQIERAIVAKYLELNQRLNITPIFSRDCSLYAESFLQRLNLEGASTEREKYILERVRFPNYQKFNFNAKVDGNFVAVNPKKEYSENKRKKHIVEMASSLFPLYLYLKEANKRIIFKNKVLAEIERIFSWFNRRIILVQNDFNDIWAQLEDFYEKYKSELENFRLNSVDFILYKRNSVLRKFPVAAADAEEDMLIYAHNKLYVQKMEEVSRVTNDIARLEEDIIKNEESSPQDPNLKNVLYEQLKGRAELENKRQLAQVQANIYTYEYCLNHSALFHLKHLQAITETSEQDISIHTFIGSILQLIGFRLRYGSQKETKSDQIGIWYIYRALKYSKCVAELIFGDKFLLQIDWSGIGPNVNGYLPIAKNIASGKQPNIDEILKKFSDLNFNLFEFFTEEEYFLLLTDVAIARFIERNNKELMEKKSSSASGIEFRTKQIELALNDRALMLRKIFDEQDQKLIFANEGRIAELEKTTSDGVSEGDIEIQEYKQALQHNIHELKEKINRRKSDSFDPSMDIYTSISIKLLVLSYAAKYRKKHGLWGDCTDNDERQILYSIKEKQELIQRLRRQ